MNWKNRKLENWENWKTGKLGKLETGKLGNGKIEKWKNRKMENWENWKMEKSKRKNGQKKGVEPKSPTPFLSLSFFYKIFGPIILTDVAPSTPASKFSIKSHLTSISLYSSHLAGIQ